MTPSDIRRRNGNARAAWAPLVKAASGAVSNAHAPMPQSHLIQYEYKGKRVFALDFLGSGSALCFFACFLFPSKHCR
jgi:hypothetical protein